MVLLPFILNLFQRIHAGEKDAEKCALGILDRGERNTG
jgi:hypothetical protein